MTHAGAGPATTVAITGLGESGTSGHDSLETLIFRGATAALTDAGLDRGDLDGVVMSASDQTDGRAISSMLTAGPTGAYLSDEINVASSPGHALAMAYLQILSGTHRRVLVSSWGKGSETAGSVQAAERLSAEPFFERDGGLSAAAAAALQAQRHRDSRPSRDRADGAAALVAAKNHADAEVDAAAVARSPHVAYPLRQLEFPPETDGAYAVVLERGDRAAAGAALAGIGWCTDSGRLLDRDLVEVPHLRRAIADAYRRAGVTDPAVEIQAWELHDYSPDAELLAYEAVGLCAPGDALELAESGETAADGALPVNRGGGSVRGEAPFGGPLRKVLDAARQVRGEAGRHQLPAVERAFAQIASGFAGQFQTAVVVARAD